ncbi:serine/threonine-protein kinase [Catenulispora rubra]|uniref:serine/threonine-protein kinase n=1 Tax=Catenulispora rubra TaxID=280293 RepID=UPI0018928291|nr:serine/threonine-protein kinase [Catenulispora rubra]
MAGWTVPGYTETRVLRTGETGRVVEAVHDASGDRVTITYPGAKPCSDPAFRERFRDEAARLAGLEHPNVVRVRELVATATAIALISEAVEGAALRRVLTTSIPLKPLTPEAALAVMKASLAGLGAAQEVGVVHRDYQPSNVVIGSDGVAKVGGFGLAVRTEAMMPAAGTPSYMAPELWEGATPRSVTDMYAVTATFYECLTGRVPYAADSVFELQTLHRAAPIPVADVPAALRPLLAQGLAKTPVERPGDTADFLAELEAAAVVEYGLEWEERGRQELAALVAALPADNAIAGTSAGQTIWYEEDLSHGLLGDDGEGMGRGTKAGLAAAAIAVIGAVVAAVAFSPGKHAAAATGPSGQLVVTPTDSSSVTDDASPGLAAGGAPTPGSSSADSSSSAKSATSGPTTPASATTTVTAPLSSATPIGLPLSSLGSPGPWPSYPPPPPHSTTVPSTPPGSTGPTTTPSVAVTISASASMANGKYSGPCPPADLPTGTVTFTVGGLPAGGTVPITYHWHVVGGGAGGATITAHDGSVTDQFKVWDDQRAQKGLSGTVDITWSAPGTPGGTTSAGSVDISCTPSGGGSSSGPTSSSGNTTGATS